MKDLKNKKVKIVKSPELLDFKLSELIGRVGIVTECKVDRSRKNKGYMVRLVEGKYEDENTWFIPRTAVQVL